MKRYWIVFAAVILSGCSAIQPVAGRFFIAPFDPNEYLLVTSLRTTAIESKPLCGNSSTVVPNVNQMYHTALMLTNYSQHLPRNEQTIKPINATHQMVHELKHRYSTETKVSKVYCELKLQSIIDTSESIQKAIAKRPRP